jgi:hypothetical protein
MQMNNRDDIKSWLMIGKDFKVEFKKKVYFDIGKKSLKFKKFDKTFFFISNLYYVII